jgi:hypothetical protein
MVVLPFRKSGAVETAQVVEEPSQSFAIRRVEGELQDKGRGVLLDALALYPDLQAQDGRLIQAIRLLNECNDHLLEASQVDAAADFIEYDERIMRAKNALRKLYALREIGDGFGATVNGVLCALQNMDGEVLSAKQVSTLMEVVKRLRNKPMLHFDSAMVLLDELDELGLDLEPPFVRILGFTGE